MLAHGASADDLDPAWGGDGQKAWAAVIASMQRGTSPKKKKKNKQQATWGQKIRSEFGQAGIAHYKKHRRCRHKGCGQCYAELLSLKQCPALCNTQISKAADPATVQLGKQIAQSAVQRGKKVKYIVDFFAGCGGFTAGAALTGYMVPLIGFDVIVNKLFILKRNFPNVTAAKYYLDLSMASDRFATQCPCTDGRNCAWKPPDADSVLSFIFHVAARRQFPNDAAKLKEAERVWAEEHKYPDFMHPIHMHGSPSCRGIAANTSKKDWKQNVTMTTMGWFASFVHYTRRRHPRMCHSMSIEEAALPPLLTKDWDKMAVNQKVAQSMRLMVTDTLGAQEVSLDRPLQSFDPNQLYWCNFNYAEHGGMPANGERLIIAQGWDLTQMCASLQPQGAASSSSSSYRVTYNNVTMADVLKIASAADNKLSSEYDKIVRGNITHMRSSGSMQRFYVGESQGGKIPKLWTYAGVKAGYGGQLSENAKYKLYYCTKQVSAHTKCGWRSTKQRVCPQHGSLHVRSTTLPKVMIAKAKSSAKQNQVVISGAGEYAPKTPPFAFRSVWCKPSYRPTRSKNLMWLRMNHPSDPQFVQRVKATFSNTGSAGWDFQRQRANPKSLYSSATGGRRVDAHVTGHFDSIVSAAAVRAFMTFPPDWKFSCESDQCNIAMVRGRFATDECDFIAGQDRPSCLSTPDVEQCCGPANALPPSDDSANLSVARFGTSGFGSFTVVSKEDRRIEPTTSMLWDHACFGDAVMPLAAFRAAMSILRVDNNSSSSSSVVSGGATSAIVRRKPRRLALVSAKSPLQKWVHINSQRQTAAALSAIYHFNLHIRRHVGDGELMELTLMLPFETYLLKNRRLNKRTVKKYISKLRALVLGVGVYTAKAHAEMVKADKHKRGRGHGGTDISAMYTNLGKWIVSGESFSFVKSLCCHLLNIPDDTAVREVREKLQEATRTWTTQQRALHALKNKLASYETSDKWEVLRAHGLDENMARGELRRLYLKAIRDLHPDRGGDAHAFVQFNRAYKDVVE